jgi:hypothetical protein
VRVTKANCSEENNYFSFDCVPIGFEEGAVETIGSERSVSRGVFDSSPYLFLKELTVQVFLVVAWDADGTKVDAEFTTMTCAEHLFVMLSEGFLNLRLFDQDRVIVEDFRDEVLRRW